MPVSLLKWRNHLVTRTRGIKKRRHPEGWRRLVLGWVDRLAIDLLYVDRAITATTRIGFGVVLHDVTAPQIVERYILQSRAMEEKILATLLLLNETKSAVRHSCDCSLCHADVLSAIETCRQSAGAIQRRPMTIRKYTINYNQALPPMTDRLPGLLLNLGARPLRAVGPILRRK